MIHPYLKTCHSFTSKRVAQASREEETDSREVQKDSRGMILKIGVNYTK